MITGNFAEHALKLGTVTLDIRERLKIATDVRDSIEIVHTSEYANFLMAFFPKFQSILSPATGGAPQFTACPEQTLRNVLLEILNRLPHNEVLRPYVKDLLTLSMQVRQCGRRLAAAGCWVLGAGCWVLGAGCWVLLALAARLLLLLLMALPLPYAALAAARGSGAPLLPPPAAAAAPLPCGAPH